MQPSGEGCRRVYGNPCSPATRAELPQGLVMAKAVELAWKGSGTRTNGPTWISGSGTGILAEPVAGDPYDPEPVAPRWQGYSSWLTSQHAPYCCGYHDNHPKGKLANIFNGNERSHAGVLYLACQLHLCRSPHASWCP